MYYQNISYIGNNLKILQSEYTLNIEKLKDFFGDSNFNLYTYCMSFKTKEFHERLIITLQETQKQYMYIQIRLHLTYVS